MHVLKDLIHHAVCVSSETQQLQISTRKFSATQKQIKEKLLQNLADHPLIYSDLAGRTKMCSILNAGFSFIKLHFSFLYGVTASLKETGMLINQAHKGCLKRETAGKKKIYNNPLLCGTLWDSLALPLPYCHNGLSLPRLPKYCACVIIHTALREDTHVETQMAAQIYSHLQMYSIN